MRIYKLRPDVTNYPMFVFADAHARELPHLDGTKLRDTWQRIAIEPFRSADNQKVPLPDFGALGTIPIFSKGAVSALRDLLGAHGELLPLDSQEGSYVAFNGTRVIDVLDAHESEILYFKSGRVKDITRFSFDAPAITAPIFKIPQLVSTEVFVTDEFVSKTVQHSLSGFEFHTVFAA